MSCQRTPEMIECYFDGELDRAGSLEIELHLQECQDCAFAYRNRMNLRTSLKSDSLYYAAPEKLKRRIHSSLQKQAISEKIVSIFNRRWLAIAASVTVIFLIGIMTWRVWPRATNSGDALLAQEIVSNHVRSLLPSGNHLSDVLSSDQHTVKPWFDGKVDFAPPVKDFSAQDFRLYGGRLEYLNNRLVATLIYQRRLHYINLYIWPARQGDSTHESGVQLQGYNLVHWTSSGMNFWAISDLNNAELRDFARLVQQSAETPTAER